MKCEAVRKSLGPWLDGELQHAEADKIQKHVDECPTCLEEKRRFLSLQISLERVLETEASRLAFEPFWNGVRQRISDDKAQRVRFLDRIRRALPPQRLAWAIPLVIIFFLGVFSLQQFFPKWRRGSNKSNLAAVESVDGHGFNVAVFRESKTKTTVIWLYQNQEEEDEPSAQSAPTDPSF